MIQSTLSPDDSREIPCLAGKHLAGKHLTVSVPGSKSITNRALLLATMADGVSTLRGALFSDDSRSFLKCIQDLGFDARADEEKKTITVNGLGGRPPVNTASVYVGSAGTAARFLTAYLGACEGVWRLDASPQMRRRPMSPLLESLQRLGCEVACKETPGFFPFTLRSRGFQSDRIRVNIEDSSQFLSALLISACLSGSAMEIETTGTHGMAYIDMTCRMMKQFGVHTAVSRMPETVFTVPAGQSYHALDYQIEPDLSAACYFYAMAALLGISVTVRHVTPSSMQGDLCFLDVLAQAGCACRETPEGICVTGPADGRLKGTTVDMSSFSDQAITLAAIAPFADGPTVITGIGHIRFQESDRIRAIVTQLSQMGIRCKESTDSITIYPGHPVPSAVDTYEDHRMAMGFSLIGLRVPGIRIRNPQCCGKTFENYFDVLDTCVAKCL